LYVRIHLRCIARGEKETGITTMLMDAGMDTGPMLLKAYSPIALFDNAEQVGATLGQMGADHTPHPTPHTPHPTSLRKNRG